GPLSTYTYPFPTRRSSDLVIFNVFFLMGVLASLNAVLTLPGIAGIVLTMGTAVDANVLIYERMREEQALGKSMRQMIADGYKHADRKSTRLNSSHVKISYA